MKFGNPVSDINATITGGQVTVANPTNETLATGVGQYLLYSGYIGFTPLHIPMPANVPIIAIGVNSLIYQSGGGLNQFIPILSGGCVGQRMHFVGNTFTYQGVYQASRVYYDEEIVADMHRRSNGMVIFPYSSISDPDLYANFYSQVRSNGYNLFANVIGFAGSVPPASAIATHATLVSSVSGTGSGGVQSSIQLLPDCDNNAGPISYALESIDVSYYGTAYSEFQLVTDSSAFGNGILADFFLGPNADIHVDLNNLLVPGNSQLNVIRNSISLVALAPTGNYRGTLRYRKLYSIDGIDL